MTTMSVPIAYERAFEIMLELVSGNDISDILEVGCGDGRFVKFMRQHGYEALGIDVQLVEAEEGVREGYILQGGSRFLDHEFGERQFDLILANRVMSTGSASAVLINTYKDDREQLRVLLPFAEELAKDNSRLMLDEVIKRLKPGGYFVAVERGIDTLAFKEEDAISNGYDVLRYGSQEAVLQKPTSTDGVIVPVQELIPGINLGEIDCLSIHGNQKHTTEAYVRRLIRTVQRLRGGRVSLSFEEQIVVDLGAGYENKGYCLAAINGARGYIGVEPFFHRGLRDSLTHAVDDLKAIDQNANVIPAAASQDHMLKFLMRLPDGSVSILMSGIDGAVLSSWKYLEAMGREITRVLSPTGAYINTESVEDSEIKTPELRVMYQDRMNFTKYVK